MAYAVLLADDHRILREGIKTILDRSNDFKVVAEAENGAEAVQICRSIEPDIVLMDIAMPGMNGIEASTEIQRHCRSTKVAILSMYDDENSIIDAIRSGARAYTLKQ